MGAAPITKAQIVRAIEAGRQAGLRIVEIQLPRGGLVRYPIAQDAHFLIEDDAKNTCDAAFGIEQ
jgi:hypothetical protein